MKTGDGNGGDPIERLQAGARAHRRPEKTPECPGEDRLRMLLPGQVEPGEAEKLLTHAAECDWCGTVLREAAQDLAEPPAGEEEELAGNSRLADPRARRELVERIARPKPKNDEPWRPIFRWWWPAAGLAAAALAVAVGYPQWARSPAHTEQLLAEAYTANRLTEMRVPGAQWGPVRTERSAGSSSSLNVPPALRDAQSNIGRGIEGHPNDPRWLRLQGEADLLDSHPDAAIPELERAHALLPGDTSILADLGAAFFQKAAQEDDPQLRTQAYERFAEGHRLKPDDPALLFDLALAAESAYAFTVARDDWNAYLRIDSKSRWAEEAQRHLDLVKKNLTGSAPTPPPQLPAR